MPEKEFELYLSLLGRFLRLRAAQRDEVADELRDHLEERLEELAARGLSREAAIRAALDEFGDAASLADHFTRVSRLRTRRLIMRCTYGSIAALAGCILAAIAFWPATPTAPAPLQAVAQQEPQAAGIAAAPGEARPPGENLGILGSSAAERRIRAALDKPTEVNFIEFSLHDAMKYLSEYHDINIVINQGRLEDEGISSDAPVSLKLSGVSFRSTLRLILEPLQLWYVIEDEVLKVTTQQMACHVIGVYDIRDLIKGGIAPKAKDAGQASLPRAAAEAAASARLEPAPWRDPPTGASQPPARGILHNTSSFAELVSRTIEPQSWLDGGGTGSIIDYNGVLVVRNSELVHSQVRDFIRLTRMVLDQ